MFVYILLAGVIGSSALVEKGGRQRGDMYLHYIGLLVFLLVVGLRFFHGDYGSYYWGYNNNVDVGGDSGYFLLQKAFKTVGFSFFSFVFLITWFSVVAFHRAFRMSMFPNFCLVVILGKIFTLYAMSGIRQYLAMAVCWWALSELLLYRRRILFVVMVLLAYTLHGSALIMLPMLFFYNRRFSILNAGIVLMVSFILAKSSMVFFDSVANMSDLVSARFQGYVEGAKEGESGMNMLNFAENFLFLVVAMVVRKKAAKHIPFYDFFLYVFVAYCGFLIVGSEVGIVKRLRDYYSIAYAFIVPGFSYLFSNGSLRKICRSIMVAYFVLLLFRSLKVYDSGLALGSYGRMVPYHSIFQKGDAPNNITGMENLGFDIDN